MARSYRTRKESVTAAERMPRNADGSIRFPRIVERRAKPGDAHPLTKADINRVFDRIPLEYLYGLDRIELRSRAARDVGDPFGCYLPDERAVILYSLPEAWHLPGLGIRMRRALERYRAQITETEAGVTVEWPVRGSLIVWFFFDVLMHELGHHFVRQYRHKNGPIRGRLYNELIADLHANRYADRRFRELRAERARRQSRSSDLKETGNATDSG